MLPERMVTIQDTGGVPLTPRARDVAQRFAAFREPGNEIFVSIGQNALVPGTSFEPQTSQVSIRLGHTLRF